MALFRARAVSSFLLRSAFHVSSRSLSPGAEIVESKEVISLMSMMNHMFTLDISSQIRSYMPLSNMRIGMQIHNIELRPWVRWQTSDICWNLCKDTY